MTEAIYEAGCETKGQRAKGPRQTDTPALAQALSRGYGRAITIRVLVRESQVTWLCGERRLRTSGAIASARA